MFIARNIYPPGARVEIVIGNACRSDAWSCYLDGKLAADGYGHFDAWELLDLLNGRGVRSWQSIEYETLPEKRWPEYLDELLRWEG